MNEPELPQCLARLSLNMDADMRAIRRAYARELKLIDQESDAAGFQLLREQYEAALQWNAWQTWESEQGESEDSAHASVCAEPEAIAAPVSLAKRHSGANLQPAPDAAMQHSPVELAFAVFGRLVEAAERLTAAPASSSMIAWEEEIRAHLAADELFNIDARIIFEQLIVDWLAAGWIPGKEKMFAAAPVVFDWEQDRRRLQQFGHAGDILAQALDERSVFLSLGEDELTSNRRIIALLRANDEPAPDRIKYVMIAVERLVTRYPHLMAVSVCSDTVARWRDVFVQRGGDMEQVRQAAMVPPSREWGGGRLPLTAAIFALIVIGRMVGSSSSSSPTPPATPAAIEAQVADAKPTRGPGQIFDRKSATEMEQSRVEAIVADIRYAFPKHAVRHIYGQVRSLDQFGQRGVPRHTDHKIIGSGV